MHYSTIIVVWLYVSYEGHRDSLKKKEVKTTEKNYQDIILEPIVKPLNAKLFNRVVWTFEEDSASTDKAKTIQRWLKENAPDSKENKH